jgi:hypothetical protein
MFALLLAAAVVSAAPADLSPNGQALVTAIAASIAQVRARQAELPPPKDDVERILRLGELDQAPRRVIMAYDFSKIPEPERGRALERASVLIKAQDHEDQDALLKLVPPEGWFAKSKYGMQAAYAAFDVIQHGDLTLQERFLPVIGRLIPSGEAPGDSYAGMYDRVEIQHDRPQLYGTQFRCDGGKWRPYPIKDFDGLEVRRKALGFDVTFAQDKATYWDAAPPCPQTGRPPPPGMKLD